MHTSCAAMRLSAHGCLHCDVQEEAATKIQQFYRKHRSTLSLRRRSFSKFGEEAFELIKRCEHRAALRWDLKSPPPMLLLAPMT